jgi:tetratricopeptide (TPR) repeat protein
MMKIYIHGNCQSILLRGLLAEQFPQWQIRNRQVHVDTEFADHSSYIRDLEEADVILSQPISAGYGPDGSRSLDFVKSHARPGATVMTFPSLFFRAQFPEWYYLNGPAGRFNSVGMAYHNVHIIAAILNGETCPRLIKRLMSPDLYTEAFVREFQQDSIAELQKREQEANIDIVASDVFAERCGQAEVMNAINHPRRTVAHVLANRVLKQLGYAGSIQAEGVEYLPLPRIVVSPSVSRWLLPQEAAANQAIEIGTKTVPYAAYIEFVYNFYLGHKREDLEEVAERSREAVAFLDRFQKAHGTGGLLRQASEHRLANPYVVNLLGHLEASKQDLERSLEEERYSSQDFIRNFHAASTKDSAAHVGLAVQLSAAGSIKEACLAYGIAEAMEPSNADTVRSRAKTLRGAKRLDEAVAAFVRYTELKPRDPAGHHDLGRVLAALRRYEQAIEAFGKALAIRPDRVDALRDQGMAFKAVRRWAEAKDALSAYLSFNPSDAATEQELALVLIELGQMQEAHDVFLRHLRNEPVKPGLHFGMGRALAGLGRMQDAKKAFEQELQHNPQHVQSFLELGRLSASVVQQSA